MSPQDSQILNSYFPVQLVSSKIKGYGTVSTHMHATAEEFWPTPAVEELRECLELDQATKFYGLLAKYTVYSDSYILSC